MVRTRRKIIWTKEAIQTRKKIFKYWNNRNKSTIYSKKLNLLFLESILQVAEFSESSVVTEKIQIRLKLVRDYQIIYEITESTIFVLDVWDTRQNPEKFPLI